MITLLKYSQEHLVVRMQIRDISIGKSNENSLNYSQHCQNIPALAQHAEVFWICTLMEKTTLPAAKRFFKKSITGNKMHLCFLFFHY